MMYQASPGLSPPLHQCFGDTVEHCLSIHTIHLVIMAALDSLSLLLHFKYYARSQSLGVIYVITGAINNVERTL